MAANTVPDRGSWATNRGARSDRERAEGRAVREYLDAIRGRPMRRGRPPTPERLRDRLEDIQRQLRDAPPLRELKLIQERNDVRRELARVEGHEWGRLEEQFIDAAASFGRQHGISYAAWREIGVPSSVLKRAGITPDT